MQDFVHQNDVPILYSIFPTQDVMLVEDGTVMGAVRFLVQYFEGLFVQGC